MLVMPFEKGVKGHTRGRPKGSKNKVTGELREMITAFLEQEFPTIQRQWKLLSPKDKAKLYTDLLNYSVPKLQAISTELDFENLTDEQLDSIIEKLMAKAQERENHLKSA